MSVIEREEPGQAAPGEPGPPNIGRELRRIRQGKKLSLRSVASAVGISPSLLSQVETGKTQPSVSTLYSLVNHLEVSLDGVMRPSPVAQQSHLRPHFGEESQPVLRKASERPVITMDNGVTWERLADGGNNIADPLVVTYPPGASSSADGTMMQHAAWEYACLTEGELVLQVDFEEYVLKPGDSVCFDAGRPHSYENRSNKPAMGLWFIIGLREMASKTLADLGLEGVPPAGVPKTPIEVFDLMKAKYPKR